MTSVRTRWRQIQRALLARPQRAHGSHEGAHGQRNVDGSYFSVWRCSRGHHGIGSPAEPPPACMNLECLGAPPPEWVRCEPEEAERFIYSLEGPSMHDGVAFRMLTR